jgi:hypothetical protein
MKNLTLSKQELADIVDGIKSSFADHVNFQSTFDIVEKIIPTSDSISTEELALLSDRIEDTLLSSVVKRIIIVKYILEARDRNLVLNFKLIWKLIYHSILDLESDSIVSSIGSQGFLSIPLYRLDNSTKPFEFLRLHIWHKSLKEHIDEDKTNSFSIHSHLFHAQSWILSGEINNTRYQLEKNEKPEDFSLFKIQWNNSKNEINTKTSTAVNTGEYISISPSEKEKYEYQQSYEIAAGEYHASTGNFSEGINATLFLFSASKGLGDNSFVVGPSKIKTSKINRKVRINPTPLIQEINKMINSYE